MIPLITLTLFACLSRICSGMMYINSVSQLLIGISNEIEIFIYFNVNFLWHILHGAHNFHRTRKRTEEVLQILDDLLLVF